MVSEIFAALCFSKEAPFIAVPPGCCSTWLAEPLSVDVRRPLFCLEEGAADVWKLFSDLIEEQVGSLLVVSRFRPFSSVKDAIAGVVIL